MKHAVLFVTVMTVFLSVTKAQKTIRGGAGYFGTGFYAMQMKPLNNVLSPNGYEKLSSSNFIFSGGGQFYINKLIIGGEGGFIGQSKVTNQTTQLSTGCGYAGLHGGYTVLETGRMLFYPLVGAGINVTGMEFKSKTGQQSFNNIIANPLLAEDRKTTMAAVSPFVQASINADLFQKSSGTAMYGYLIGLSVGYRYCGSSNFWNYAGTELKDSPDFSARGFFATVRFGGGYRGYKK